MNEMSKTEITDKKKRYAAGVLKYAQMGYWMGITPPRTPTFWRCSASPRRRAWTRSRRRQQWRAKARPRPNRTIARRAARGRGLATEKGPRRMARPFVLTSRRD